MENKIDEKTCEQCKNYTKIKFLLESNIAYGYCIKKSTAINSFQQACEYFDEKEESVYGTELL